MRKNRRGATSTSRRWAKWASTLTSCPRFPACSAAAAATTTAATRRCSMPRKWASPTKSKEPRMATLIATLGVAHAPGVTGWIDKAPEHQQQAVLKGYQDFHDKMEALKPD